MMTASPGAVKLSAPSIHRAAERQEKRMTTYDELLDDLAAEQRALGSVLAHVTPAQWELPTHAPGWRVRDQVAHLAHFDEMARLAIVDADRFAEDVAASRGDRAAGYEPRYLARGRGMTPPELFGWWRDATVALVAAARIADPKARLPWYGPEMGAVSFVTARLMETWSHGLDVVDVVGVERPDTDRLRHVVFIGVRTRPFSYTNRGVAPDMTPVCVELKAPSGATWTHGEPDAENRIAGTAVDFCRVVTQRRHVADTDLEIVGPSAQDWMRLAQTFAGPPGEGRRPGQFPKESAR